MKSFIIKYGALRFLMLFAVVCFSWAIAASGAGNEDSEGKIGLTDLERRMQKRIFIDVNELSIDTVIRQLAEQADIDIIKSPKVVGNVTVTLTDVPLEEALSSILAVHDCTYVLTENVMRIITSEEMVAKAEPILTKTYEIVYADAAEVVAALDKFKSPRGSVSSIKGTSHIIVTDTESKIREISALLDKIDRITPQILVEARIYDITSQETLDLGVQWNAGRRTDITFDAALGTNPTSGPRNPFLLSGFNNATGETGTGVTGVLRMGWLNSSIDIDAILKAQQEIVHAKLLANPRILVLDNEIALFDIVREIPYTESTVSTGGSTETVIFKEIGVRLVVTPHVTRNGMIRLRIQPEFGVLVSQHPTTLVPTVDTRKLDTTALIRDGQTVVLGGLRKKDVSQQINKIPLLGDLPLIGGLFRFEGEDTTITELVVFITPRIIIEQPVLSLDEQLAFEETNFNRPEPSSTRAEKKANENELK